MDHVDHHETMPAEEAHAQARTPMSRQKRKPQAARQMPEDQISIPPNRLLPFSAERFDDHAQKRDAIYQSLSDIIKPQNVIDEQAVAVMAGLHCDLLALERYRHFALEFARRDAIIALLLGRLENVHARVLSMYKGDQAAYDEINAALNRFDISDEAIEAQAYLISLDTMDRLHRLAVQTQIRLDLQLKEIERLRPFIMPDVKAVIETPVSADKSEHVQETA